MQKDKKIYFASDVHLGLPSYIKSREREKIFVKWLDEIKSDAEAIYLLGDIFDFWFEYKHAIPRGFTRFLGKLTEITDSGIPVYFFTGNHDMWVFDYLPEETGVHLIKNPIEINVNGKTFYLAHGDGMDWRSIIQITQKIFASRFAQWLFARFHPNLGIKIANLWSVNSRYSNETPTFEGEDKEWLIIHSKELLQKKHYDYLVFGHRHIPIQIDLKEKSQFINLGDWINHFSYAEFDGNEMKLKYYKKH